MTRVEGPIPDDLCRRMSPVLTEQEAVRYLRLDETKVKNPADSLTRYRRKGLLRGVQIGREIRYHIEELNVLIQKLMEVNPR